jgi:hypothetical protein
MSKLRSNTLSFDRTHYVEGTKGTFTYRLPQPREYGSEDTISLQEISFYNSFFNIEAHRNNNKFSIIWNADTSVQYDFTIEDSYLEISDINEYLKAQCLINKLYMIETATGKTVQFVTCETIASRYIVEFKFYELPTSAQATTLGYTIPSGATWSFPTSAKTPQVVFANNEFGTLLGFNPSQTIPTTPQSSYTQILSDNVPQIVPVTNIKIGCNLINNEYTIPNTIMSSVPLNGAFLDLLFFQNSSAHYSNIKPSRYDEITIRFYDQLNNELSILDKNINILLNIKTKI